MKIPTLLILTLAMLPSCSTTKAFINSDQSISISHRGAFEIPADLWITGASDGVLTPAGRLKVIQTTTIKGTHRRELKCVGFVDRSVPGKVELQLARTGDIFPNSTWSKHSFSGTYKLHLTSN